MIPLLKSHYLDHLDATGKIHTQWMRRYWEGRTAINAAIAFLNAQPALPAIVLDLHLSHVNYQHANECSDNNKMSYYGDDGSLPWDRVRTHGGYRAFATQMTTFTSNQFDNPFVPILNLIIADGDSQRRSRRNIFSTTYNKLGLGVSKSAAGKFYIDISYVKGFTCATNCNLSTSEKAEVGF